MKMKVAEIEAKSIITSSKLPDTDYVVNPYIGCRYGCAYCYASFMGRFVNEKIQNWGNYVFVKANAPELISQEVKRMSSTKRKGSILLSSVTDPYQGLEAKHKLTRRILNSLVDNNYPGKISILTKSPLVVRDIDLLAKLKSVEVGFTITTTDDKISRWLEVRAPKASQRLKALKEINDANISSYVFVGPLLPHFSLQPHLLNELFSSIADTGTQEVYIEHINLKRYIRQRLDKFIESESQDIQNIYKAARYDEHRVNLEKIILPLLKKHNLRLRLGQVLYHEEKK